MRLLVRVGKVDFVIVAVYIQRAAIRIGTSAAVVRKVVNAIVGIV